MWQTNMRIWNNHSKHALGILIREVFKIGMKREGTWKTPSRSIWSMTTCYVIIWRRLERIHVVPMGRERMLAAILSQIGPQPSLRTNPESEWSVGASAGAAGAAFLMMKSQISAACVLCSQSNCWWNRVFWSNPHFCCLVFNGKKHEKSNILTTFRCWISLPVILRSLSCRMISASLRASPRSSSRALPPTLGAGRNRPSWFSTPRTVGFMVYLYIYVYVHIHTEVYVMPNHQYIYIYSIYTRKHPDSPTPLLCCTLGDIKR